LSNGVAVTLSDVSQASPLGQVLTDQPVGAFTGSAFPRMMGIGEVEDGIADALDGAAIVELGSVVGADGADASLFVAIHLDDASVEFGGSTSLELSDEGISGDHGNDAITVVGAHDGIDFPVADTGALFRASWAVGDVAFPA
jgi:hypothetical protein